MRNFTSLIAFVVAVISITAAAVPASEFDAKVNDVATTAVNDAFESVGTTDHYRRDSAGELANEYHKHHKHHKHHYRRDSAEELAYPHRYHKHHHHYRRDSAEELAYPYRHHRHHHKHHYRRGPAEEYGYGYGHHRHHHGHHRHYYPRANDGPGFVDVVEANVEN